MFRKPKTVEFVMRSLVNLHNDLVDVENQQAEASKKATDDVENARARVRAANEEAERAARIRGRLEDLFE